jgi:kinesin family protein 1
VLIFANIIATDVKMDDALRLRNSSIEVIANTKALQGQCLPAFLDSSFLDSVVMESRKSDTSQFKHDLYASIEVCELAPCGNYLPVTVMTDSYFAEMDPGVFFLRQGVQRRITIGIVHDSGSSLKLQRVSQVRVSRIRSCERNGKNIFVGQPDPDTFDLTLRLYATQKNIPMMKDGRSFLWAEAAWDSSLHESSLLNRITCPNGESRGRHRIIATLSWFVEAEGCSQPLSFETDIFLHVLARDAKLFKETSAEAGTSRGLFSGIFTSRTRKSIGKVSRTFQAELSPISGQSATALDERTLSLQYEAVKRRKMAKQLHGKYVRGEENLGDWRPKGLELLSEDAMVREKIFHLLDVQETRERLSSMEFPVLGIADRENHLRQIIDLWQRAGPSASTPITRTRYTSTNSDSTSLLYVPQVELQKKS